MNNQKNYLERTTFFVGLLILAILIGYLSIEILGETKKVPALEVQFVHQPALPGNTYKIDIKNNGGETAKEALIFFHLYQNGRVVESAQLKIGYVPVHSEVSGWISFSRDAVPTDSLAVGPISFLKP